MTSVRRNGCECVCARSVYFFITYIWNVCAHLSFLPLFLPLSLSSHVSISLAVCVCLQFLLCVILYFPIASLYAYSNKLDSFERKTKNNIKNLTLLIMSWHYDCGGSTKYSKHSIEWSVSCAYQSQNAEGIHGQRLAVLYTCAEAHHS